MKTELRKREDLPPLAAHRVENAADPAQWPDAELVNTLKTIFPPVADLVGTIKQLRTKELYLLAPGVAKKPLSQLPPLAPKPLIPASSSAGATGGGVASPRPDPRVYVPTEQEEKELTRKIALSETAPPRPLGSMPAAEQSATTAELAASEGSSPEQIQARKKLARDFYAEQCPEMKASNIEEHTAAIDFSKPVKVIQIPPEGGGLDGNEIYQHSFPGGGNGQYFVKSRAVQPEQVGASKTVLVPGSGTTPPRIVPRETRHFSADNNAPVIGLQSTSAPIKDTWSHSGEPKDTPGGGTQVFIPRKQQKGIHQN